jgi:AraC-type DNA-binding domain-containing proteins
MKHDEAYRFPELDPMGYSEESSYLIVNCVGYYEFEEFYKPTHRKNGRKDYYLAYNQYGQVKVRMKGIDHIIEPGTVFIYNPLEEQYYGHSGKSSFLCYWVHFTGYGVEELLEKAELTGSNIYYVGVRKGIIDLFEEMLMEIRDKNPGYGLAASSLLSYLISVISRYAGNNSYKNMNGNRNEIYKTIRYIHENYSSNISIKGLAHMSHLCKDRYTVLFKEIMQVTPQKYIIRLKIQKACELLKRTNLNISQISAMVGFNDQLYFSRIFKKYEGMTPSDYMRKYK